MGNKLIEINHLQKQNGLWVLNEPTGFDYTDGEASELFLKRVVSEAKDISSMSLELESSYPDWDWVSEYHLSAQRTNILKGLDLSKMSHVLEIGCGCGAITRYLGELGMNVTAIEGAQRRAEIAQLRCRDLDNVRIVNANFNDIILPENCYDAVFAIGVIEYATRFLCHSGDDEAAVVDILNRLKQTLVEGGVVAIAIENRNGLKYWLGATEDHFGKPFVGINNYWGHSGARTYSQAEWQDLLQRAGMEEWRYQYPFPDYKLPQVILGEKFIDQDEFAYSLLYRVGSRDYLRPWQPAVNEFSVWRTLQRTGELKYFANAFLILAGGGKTNFDHIAPIDFAHFSGTFRKPRYRTVTVKNHYESDVIKKNTWVEESTTSQDLKHQELHATYHSGELLSTQWLDGILSGDPGRFKAFLESYYNFIEEKLRTEPTLPLLDALPANIVVDGAGAYHLIDQEWEGATQPTVAHVLFRGLLWFAHHNLDLLQPFFEDKKIKTLQSFIEYGFNLLGLETVSQTNQFAEFESALQFEVSKQKYLGPIRQVLQTPVQNPSSKGKITTSVMWASGDQPFTPVNSKELIWQPDAHNSEVTFRFSTQQRVDRFRVKPLDKSGLFSVRKMSITWRSGGGGDPITPFKVDAIDDFLSRVSLNEMILTFIKPRGTLLASTNEASFDIKISWPKEIETGAGFYQCKILFSNTIGHYFCWAEERVHRTMESFKAKYNHEPHQLTNYLAQENKHLNNVIVDLEIEKNKAKNLTHHLRRELESTRTELENARKLLNGIRSMKLMRIAAKLRSGYGLLFNKLKRLSAGHSLPEVYQAIQKSGLFDVEYYKSQKPELESFGGDSLRHYLAVGANQGFNPHRLFNTRYYLAHAPDVFVKNVNPLYHYLLSGAYEGNNPCYLFSNNYYLKENSELVEEGINPLFHYISEGTVRGCRPHPIFDIQYYYHLCPGAKESGLTPLEYFLAGAGKPQGSPTALFDEAFYLSNRTDVDKAGLSALPHFLEHGYIERLSDPCPLFKRDYYYRQNPDVWEQKGNALIHFVEKGQFAGKSPHPMFDVDFYKEQMPEQQNVYIDPLSHYIVMGAVSGLKPHALYDPEFYLEQIDHSNLKPHLAIEHFFQIGAAERINPHPLFDCSYYLAQLPDGKTHDIDNSVLDYCENVNSRKLNPHPLFDSCFYISQVGEDEIGTQSPLEHYVRVGCRNNLSTHPGFSVDYYLGLHPDIDPAFGQGPVVHYIYEGSQNEQWPSHKVSELEHKPKFSFFIVVDGPDFRYMPGVILAVMSQLYPRWEMTVVVRNADETAGCQRARQLARKDRRIKFVETNDEIPFAKLCNDALSKFDSDHLIFLNDKTFLQPHALLTFVEKLNEDKGLALIHAVEAINDPQAVPINRICDEQGGVTVRFFVGPLACFKVDVIRQIGGLQSWSQSAHDERFLITYLEQVAPESIISVNEPLHHTLYSDPLHIHVREK